MNKLLDFDNTYSNFVVGVDEVGRGPLAGPVVAAAARLINYIDEFNEIDDSKKLTEKKREKLYDLIINNCEIGIGIIDNNKIDEINILNATFDAMKLAINQISKLDESIILVDGNQKIRNFNKEHKTIIKGDQKSFAIAAASIVAKVTRDRMMIKYANEYPRYAFEKHKGYGTKIHREALLEYGPCKLHRQTFIRKIMESKNEIN